MNGIALGATVFNRHEKVDDLLESADEVSCIESVYLGDNGRLTENKKEIYNRNYSFDLEVLDLEYDSGLGHSRREIVKQSDEPFLLIVDSDVEVPKNVSHLYSILDERPTLGGVGGVLIESDRIRSDCHDLFLRDNLLVKHINESKTIQSVDGLPAVEFDLIQNVAMYRRECLEDYCWDPEYKIGWEHTDFFVGHKKQTDWSFAVCPEVLFRHYPGGGSSYVSKRRNRQRIEHSKQYFLKKWGYQQVLMGHINWLQTSSGLPTKQRIVEQSVKHVILSLPPNAQIAVMNLRDSIRKLRGQPPV